MNGQYLGSALQVRPEELENNEQVKKLNLKRKFSQIILTDFENFKQICVKLGYLIWFSSKVKHFHYFVSKTV